MNQRERILALSLATVVGGWLVWSIISSRIIQPLRDRDAQLIALRSELTKQQASLRDAQRAAVEISQWRQVALPAEESLAQTLYLDHLRKILTEAGIDRPTLRPSRAIRRNDLITRIPVNIDAQTTLEQLTKFLVAVDQAPLLQQVRRLVVQPIIKDDKLSGVNVSITLEAVSFVDAFAKDALPTREQYEKAMGTIADRQPVEVALFRDKNLFQPSRFVDVNAVVDQKDAGKSGEADERSDYYLSATIFVDGLWQVWLTKKSDQTRKVVKQGETLEVGGMSAQVIQIAPDAAVLQVGDKQGPLKIGSSLSSWKESPVATDEAPNGENAL